MPDAKPLAGSQGDGQYDARRFGRVSAAVWQARARAVASSGYRCPWPAQHGAWAGLLGWGALQAPLHAQQQPWPLPSATPARRRPEPPQPEIKQLGRYVQVRPWGSPGAHALAAAPPAAPAAPAGQRRRRMCPMCAARGHLPAYASATSAAPGDHLYHLFPVQLGILGSGTYGLVVRARDTSDPDAQDVAIKLLPRGGFVSRGIGVGLLPGWGGPKDAGNGSGRASRAQCT